MTADSHPPSSTWLEFALDLLEPAERRALARHARACPRCRASRDAAGTLARAMAPVVFENVPPAVHRRLVAVFSRTTAAPRPVVALRPERFGRMRLLVAPRPLASSGLAAMRGAAATRTCSLAAGDHRIDLEWSREGTGWLLRGRIDGGRAGERAVLVVEPPRGKAIRVAPGPRGFFGPIRLAASELRVRFESGARAWRSRWLPSAPRREN